MSDIVEYLKVAASFAPDARLYPEAIAEILRLRAELAALREPAGDLVEVAARILFENTAKKVQEIGVWSDWEGQDNGWYRDARAVLDAVLPRVRADAGPRPLEEWNENIGPVLWWRFPVDEAPWVGTPNDLGHTVELRARDGLEPRIAARCTIGGWPGYHTHWTPLPPLPDAAP